MVIKIIKEFIKEIIKEFIILCLNFNKKIFIFQYIFHVIIIQFKFCLKGKINKFFKGVFNKFLKLN